MKRFTSSSCRIPLAAGLPADRPSSEQMEKEHS